jgi:hypothetical protein
MTEFWNDSVTEASWKKLQELGKEIDFVLIGGWAVYLYTKLHKSKDIDIIVDYQTLRRLGALYRMNKNDRLKKYEVVLDKFDIDVYLPGYSKLALPVEDIVKDYSAMKSGFKVPIPEALMTLKLGAYFDRSESMKGDKDSIDLMGLLFYGEVDVEKLGVLLKRHGLASYARTLLKILVNFDKDMLKFLNLNEKSFSVLRKRYEPQVRGIL